MLVHRGRPLLSCLQDVSTHSSTQISTLQRSSRQIVTQISAEIKQIWTEIHHLVHNRRLYLSREQQPYIHLNANRVRVLGKLTWQMIWRCQSPDKLLSSCMKAHVNGAHPSQIGGYIGAWYLGRRISAFISIEIWASFFSSCTLILSDYRLLTKGRSLGVFWPVFGVQIFSWGQWNLFKNFL